MSCLLPGPFMCHVCHSSVKPLLLASFVAMEPQAERERTSCLHYIGLRSTLLSNIDNIEEDQDRLVTSLFARPFLCPSLFYLSLEHSFLWLEITWRRLREGGRTVNRVCSPGCKPAPYLKWIEHGEHKPANCCAFFQEPGRYWSHHQRQRGETKLWLSMA